MNGEAPAVLALLANQPSSGAPTAAGPGAWLQLSPDTMHQYHLCSQQLCLVGLCATTGSRAATPSVTAAGTPLTPHGSGSSGTNRGTPSRQPVAAAASPSRFGPAARSPSPEDISLLDLWLRAGLHCSSSNNEAVQQLAGRFLVPVTVWPSAKLARGSALLNPGAWDSLTRPDVGSFLAVYTLQQAAVASPAKQLELYMCVDTAHRLPLTPKQINSSNSSSTAAIQVKAASTAAIDAYRTPGKSSTQSSNNKTTSMPSSSKGSIKSASSKKKQQQQGRSSSTSSGDRAPPADIMAQWQLQLLQNGIDWSKAKHRQLLQQLAHIHLAGRALLPGNVTYLPMLGLHVLHLVQPKSAGQQQQQQQLEPSTVTPSTQVLVYPPSTAATDPIALFLTSSFDFADSSSSSSAATQAATAAMAAAAGLAAPAAAAAAGGSGRDLPAAVAAAREAAQGAVSGSVQDAAMAAAERAVRAGAAAAAGSSGYRRLGGISSYSNALRELVLLPLQLPQLFAKYKLRPPRGLLLHGPPGSGKTALARAAAVEAGATLLVVNGPDTISEFYGESEAGLTGIFAAATVLSPSVVFIDEIDAIAPSRDAHGHGGASSHTAAAGDGSGGSAAGEAAARVLTQLLTLMDGLHSSSSMGGSNAAAAGGGGIWGSGDGGGAAAAASSSGRVVVIAATNRPSALDPALRRPGRFDRELEVRVPDPKAREDILRVRLSSIKHCLTANHIAQLAATTHGFVGADLAALVNEAALGALRRYAGGQQQQQQQHQRSLQQTQEDDAGQESQSAGQHQHAQKRLQQQQEAEAAQQRQPSDQQQPLCVAWDDVAAARLLVKPSALREVAVEVPKVSWDDVGGLSSIKQRLQEAVLWPQQHADALQRLGATAPKGILLYGPPGCSKTLLARAVAATAGLNFLSIKGGELYSQYVGESERAVAALFTRARGAAPSVIFFDEIDALVGNRSDAGGAGVGERVLAQLLTEMDGLQARLGVVVLAATNRPDKVDPALLRPGRFDRLLLVPPPDMAARQEIFRVLTRRTPLNPDVELHYLAQRTEGYTGADISALCREAAMSALEENLQASAVAARHFDLALLRVKPSSSPNFNTMSMYQQFQRHSRLAAA